MQTKYLNKYRKASARLTTYDYGSNGNYFVTIETNKLKNYFGEVVQTDNCPSIQLTQIGHIADEYWNQIPKHYPFVGLDAYQIMPNHIHGILCFNKEEIPEWHPNEFGAQSQNLGAVIRGFKSTLKRYANQHNIDFQWKARYHDTIIRNDKALQNIRNYIQDNINAWAKKYGYPLN